MKTKVMNAKKGVITEPRFSELTTLQWLYHYEEVMKHEDEDRKFIVSIVTESLKIINDSIIGGQEMNASLLGGSKVVDILKQMKEVSEAREDIDEEEFDDEYVNLKKSIPATLSVKIIDNKQKTKKVSIKDIKLGIEY